MLDGLWRRLGIDTVMTQLLASGGLAPRSSGCCSGWSPTGRWPRPRSWLPRTGSPTTCTSTGFPRPATMSATGDGLAPRRPRTPRTRGVRAGREPAQPRSRPAVLRHHLHLLRTGRPRRTRGPRRTRPPPARPTAPEHDRRQDAAARTTARTRSGSGPTASRRTPATTYPQIVIGMAVTRDGIPVRVWCWPGNTERLRADPPGQRRHAGLDPVEDRVGRRPRVLL